jgi:hypothetical protein
MTDFNRVPVSVSVVTDGNDQFVVVVCDDGAVFRSWASETPMAWDEAAPIPGSVQDGERQKAAFVAEMRKTFPVAEWSDMMHGLYSMANGDADNARILSKTLLARAREVHSQAYSQQLSLAAEVLGREGWPEFVTKLAKDKKARRP